MSHFLTRLVDRTIGTSSAIAPVRLPLFTDASSGSDKQAGYTDGGLTYGDLIRGTQLLPQQTRMETDGIARSVSREVEREETSVQPLESFRRDGLSIPNVSKSVAKGLPRQNQEHDIAIYPTDETTRHTVHAEAATTEPGDLTSEPVANTPHSGQKNREQPINHAVNKPLHSHVTLDTGESMQSSNSLPDVNSDYVLSPRVSPASSLQSFSMQQAIIGTQEKVESQPRKPPTIQVTIGRIEVKAAAMPPPPQTPMSRTKSQPSLSLDDYLKQRSGDRR